MTGTVPDPAGDSDFLPDTVPLPITGELDLHTFRPRDVADVVAEYLRECQSRGVRRVRIIHGKGMGQLREVVHRELGKNPAVASFQLAGSGMGGWGATMVDLCPGVGERIEGNGNHS